MHAQASRLLVPKVQGAPAPLRIEAALPHLLKDAAALKEREGQTLSWSESKHGSRLCFYQGLGRMTPRTLVPHRGLQAQIPKLNRSVLKATTLRTALLQ